MAMVDIYGKVRGLEKGDRIAVRAYGDTKYSGVSVEFLTEDIASLRLATNNRMRDSKIVFEGVKFDLTFAGHILALIEVITDLKGKVVAKNDNSVMFQLE
jgi:hypothetical protein